MFNFVAPIYKRVDKTLFRNFSFAMEVIEKEVSLKGKTILDLGSGTGVWGYSLLKKGAAYVYGIDLSEKMVEAARKKFPELTFSVGNIEALEEIEPGSFDIVTASFVMHGVTESHRQKILNEISRIGKSEVIIQDYIGKTPLTAKFLEFMEKSDYKNFKINFPDELAGICNDIRVIPIKSGTGLYLGRIRSSVISTGHKNINTSPQTNGE